MARFPLKKDHESSVLSKLEIGRKNAVVALKKRNFKGRTQTSHGRD